MERSEAMDGLCPIKLTKFGDSGLVLVPEVTSNFPSCILLRRAIVRNKEVFPHPFGPETLIACPAFTLRL